MIRKLEETDIPAIAEMMERVFMDDIVEPAELKGEIKAVYVSPKFWKRKLGECEIFADEEDGKLTVLGAYKDNEVDKLYVALNAKGKGKGSLMLGFLENRIRENGNNGVFLYALMAAVGFYEKKGYSADGDGKIELPGGVVPTKLMRKKLA
jgi:GNAT superfamily N-acetyltransferase